MAIGAGSFLGSQCWLGMAEHWGSNGQPAVKAGAGW